MNPLLQTIATKAGEDLYDLIRSGNDDILTAIHKMQAESQLQETNPKFSLGFKITVDFDKGNFDCDLSWSLKQTLGVSHKIEDPNQQKLPMDITDQTIPLEKRMDAAIENEGTIRIVSPNGTDTGDVPMSTMKAALKVLKHKQRK